MHAPLVETTPGAVPVTPERAARQADAGSTKRREADWLRETGQVGLELIPETVIEEREHWTLAVNRNQDLLGKSMVVLRRECTAVVDIRDEEWANLRHELRRLVPALTELFNPDQVNYAFLMNLDAQVHLHVIPRYAKARRWHDLMFEDAHWGSAFGHEQRVLDSDALAALAGHIRSALQTAP